MMKTNNRRLLLMSTTILAISLLLFLSQVRPLTNTNNNTTAVLPGPKHVAHPMIPAPQPTGYSSQSAIVGCPEPAAQCAASYNWGGYAVTAATNTVTVVQATWKVPAISGASGTTCPDSDTTWYDAAVWIGIDGYSSSTVEQTGTSSDCYYGQTNYYAWYEFYPAGSVNTGLTISPGDKMSATVSYSGGLFTATIKDTTTGKSFTSPATAVSGALRNSAEWIEESAYYNGFLALTHVGTVSFSAATVTISGVTHPISGWGANVIWMLMIDYNWPSVSTLAYAKAEPSALNSGGNGFTSKWLSNGP